MKMYTGIIKNIILTSLSSYFCEIGYFSGLKRHLWNSFNDEKNKINGDLSDNTKKRNKYMSPSDFSLRYRIFPS